MALGKSTKVLIAVFLYIALFTIFSIKTIYYYQSNVAWWFYTVFMSICFVYFIFHCKTAKRHTNYLMIFLVGLFSLFPLEVELIRFFDAIWGSGIQLSGLGLMMPNTFTGTAFDLLLFPLLILIIMYLTKCVFNRRDP